MVAENLNISTTSGVSQGFLINGVANWDDIPYAQPPVGDLRWKAPREINILNYNYLKIIIFVFKAIWYGWVRRRWILFWI